MTDQLQAARDSFSGKAMTETQVRQAHAIAGILYEEIQRSGTFREALTDYSHAFSRTEKFDAMRAEKMLRDSFQARYGQTLNQTREGFKTAEESLPDNARTRTLECAESIGPLIQAAPTQPFYKAYDRAAVTLSAEFGITQYAAKAMMKDAFEQRHSRDLYVYGKEIEEANYKPVRNAEIAARKAESSQTRSQSRSMD